MSVLQVVILHYKVEKRLLEKKKTSDEFPIGILLCIVVESIGIREIKHRVYGKREK